MAIPSDLKFDVRVRERLLADGLVTEAEIEKYVTALPDLEAEAVELTAKQPALQKESDRDIVIVRTSGVRPPIAPVIHDDSDLPIDDDDDLDDDLDDEDDDEDEDEDKAEAKAKKPEKAEKAEKPAPAEEADDGDDDEDGEDESSEGKSEEAPDDDWGGG
jgi:hypothetical protein